MGLFKATVFKAKEDGKKMVSFEPTVMKEDPRTVRIPRKDLRDTPVDERKGFAMGLTQASRRFKRRFL